MTFVELWERYVDRMSRAVDRIIHALELRGARTTGPFTVSGEKPLVKASASFEEGPWVDIWFQAGLLPDRKRVRFLLTAEAPESKYVLDFMDAMVDPEDEEETERRFRGLEDLGNIERFVHSILPYLWNPPGAGGRPKEWSPRWSKGPDLGAAAPKKFPSIRVNIVEEDGWKTWDPAGDISNWASDNAWYDWQNMDDATCREHVSDLVAASMNKREQKRVGDEELGRICEHLREEGWSGDLESTHHAIVDALAWMWEEAYTPDDDDIGSAMEEAAEYWADEVEFGDHWELVVGERAPLRKGPKEWMPRAAKWTPKAFVDELAKYVTYERKPGWYDRHIVFDFGAAKPVGDFLGASETEKGRHEGRIRALDRELPDLPETQEGYGRRAEIEGEIRGIQAEIDELDEAVSGLKDEFQGWSDLYLRRFFRALDKVMKDADPGQKTDWRKHWKSMLSDKRTMGAVREEILEFLKKPAEKAD